MNILEMKCVSSSYGKLKILHNVSMQVSQGEAVCLLGSNGAGKSTTIKTILGIVQPTSGDIFFKNINISNFSTDKIVNLGIGVVPEGRGIFLKMSVQENLAIGARINDRKIIKARIDKIYNLFPRLKDRHGQVAGTLSGGEQAMVAFGRAMMGEPEMLIMDEPSLGLSPIMIDTIFGAMEQVIKLGTSVLLIEQNADKALRATIRGYIMQKGQVIGNDFSTKLLGSSILDNAYLG
jgi:branched-chain amino acid transport system ATP-binding protein